MSRTVSGGGFRWTPTSSQEGGLNVVVSGQGAYRAFADESGGHRFQRVPPTEKRGRVHTSTITVAVFREGKKKLPALSRASVVETRYSGSGAGGQHRNKHANCVRLTDTTSGIVVQVEGKHYHRNREAAWRQLEQRRAQIHQQQRDRKRAVDRKGQVGSGERGDKRRTIAIQRDQVTDHEAGWTTTYKKYARGIFPPLEGKRKDRQD